MRVDEISLTLPADEAFHRVAHLVLGGLAARLDLTVDDLDDLQVALDGLLDYDEGGNPVTLRVRVREHTIEAAVGPFGAALGAELEHAAGDDLDLRRILEAVCDRVEVADGWVELTKRINGGR